MIFFLFLFSPRPDHVPGKKRKSSLPLQQLLYLDFPLLAPSPDHAPHSAPFTLKFLTTPRIFDIRRRATDRPSAAISSSLVLLVLHILLILLLLYLSIRFQHSTPLCFTRQRVRSLPSSLGIPSVILRIAETCRTVHATSIDIPDVLSRIFPRNTHSRATDPRDSMCREYSVAPYSLLTTQSPAVTYAALNSQYTAAGMDEIFDFPG